MSPSRLARSVPWLSAILLAICPIPGSTQEAPARGGIVLVHSFRLPADLAWGSVSVSLTPQAWRVGSAQGPVASEAQLRAVLSRLAEIDIGGRCAGWVDGGTSYPCSFAVSDVDLGGTVNERYGALGADWRLTPEAARGLPGAENPDDRASGSTGPVQDTPRLVAVRLPRPYVGDKSKAFGAKLEFRIRTVSNPLMPSQFERASGSVVLRARPAVKEGDASAGRRGAFESS
jgi:hypothetical protein